MSAKKFFLTIGVLITMYVSVGSLIALLFGIIDYIFPPLGVMYTLSSISFPVATLIIVFPLFLWLSVLLQKEERVERIDLYKWFTYLTLFLSGGIGIGDLVTILYKFLDGQDLTAGFLYKVVSLAVIMGVIFAYHISAIKNPLSKSSSRIWGVVATVCVCGSIVWGFAVFGSPATQRMYGYDMQKVNDLQSIMYMIENYIAVQKELPQSLDDLSRTEYPGALPSDPQTQKNYEYKKTNGTSYVLCATFNKASRTLETGYSSPSGVVWTHPAGYYCFSRSIPEKLR
jgi:hypothetical protein